MCLFKSGFVNQHEKIGSNKFNSKKFSKFIEPAALIFKFLKNLSMSKYWFCLLLFFPLCLHGQKSHPGKPDCEAMVAKGDSLFQLANPPLKEVLRAYLNALNCNSKLSSVLGPKIEVAFEAIEARERFAVRQQEIAKEQRNIAETQKKFAEAQQKLAKKAEAEAIKNLKEAQRQAQIGEARRLAFLSIQESSKKNHTDAIRLAYRAHQIAEDTTLLSVQRAFAEILFKHKYLLILDTILQQPGNIKAAGFSPDSRFVSLLEEGGSINHFPIDSGEGWQESAIDSSYFPEEESAPNWRKQRLIEIRTGDTIFSPVGDLKLIFLDSVRVKIRRNKYLLAVDPLYRVDGGRGGMYKGTGFHPPVSYSANGRYFQICSKNIAEVWDRSGNKQGTIEKEKPIVFAAFSPNGDQLLLRTLKNESGSPTFTHKRDTVFYTEYNSYKYLFEDKSFDPFQLYDKEGNLLFNFPAQIESIRFSPDGNHILGHDKNHSLYLWQIISTDLFQQTKNRFTEAGKRIGSADFTTDYVIMGGSYEDFYLGDIYGNILQHFEEAKNVSFLKTRPLILYSAWYPARKFHRFLDEKGKPHLDFSFPNKALDSFEIVFFAISDIEHFAVAQDEFGYVSFLDLEQKKAIYPDSNFLLDFKIISADFSADESSVLFKNYNDKKVPDTGAKSYLFGTDGKWYGQNLFGDSKVGFLPNSNLIFAPFNKDTVRIWDKEGQFLADLPHIGPVNHIQISSNENWLFTRHSKDSVNLWTLNGAHINFIEHRLWEDYSMPLLTPDGKQFLTMNGDGHVVLRDIKGNLLKNTKDFFVGFWPEVPFFLTAQGTVWTFDGEKERMLEKVTAEIISATFSAEYKRIVGVTSNGIAQVWGFDGTLYSNLNDVEAALFSPDGKFIITQSKDRIGYWDLNGKLLAEIDYKNLLRTEQEVQLGDSPFSPDGSLILIQFGETNPRHVLYNIPEPVSLWKTPLWLIRWLQENPLPPFSEEEKRVYDIKEQYFD